MSPEEFETGNSCRQSMDRYTFAEEYANQYLKDQLLAYTKHINKWLTDDNGFNDGMVDDFLNEILNK